MLDTAEYIHVCTLHCRVQRTWYILHHRRSPANVWFVSCEYTVATERSHGAATTRITYKPGYLKVCHLLALGVTAECILSEPSAYFADADTFFSVRTALGEAKEEYAPCHGAAEVTAGPQLMADGGSSPCPSCSWQYAPAWVLRCAVQEGADIVLRSVLVRVYGAGCGANGARMRKQEALKHVVYMMIKAV